MAFSNDIKFRPKGAVFVSYGPPDEQHIFEVADKITRNGWTVFLDEACYRSPRESHILDAINFADELLILITNTRRDSLKKDSIPAFLDRRFIWLAVAVAFARGIPIGGLLKGIKEREVDEDPDIPAFIKGITRFEKLEQYLEQCEANLQEQPSKARPDATRRPKSNCRACLFCGPRTVPALTTIERQLKRLGMETNLWHSSSNVDHFDAMAILFHDAAGKIWQTPRLIPFVQACLNKKKPVVLLTLPSNRRSPDVPKRFKQELSHVEYRKSNNLSLLQLVWAIVGYRPYDLTGVSPHEQFDVFISHNGNDKPFIRQLGEALRERGLKVWLDEEKLIPGRTWQNELELIITTCNSAMVCVGKDGIGPWEEPEMRALLRRFIKDKTRGKILPIIPVLLPGAPSDIQLPLFLAEFTWVDLRTGLSKEGLDRLQWGIKGKKPES